MKKTSRALWKAFFILGFVLYAAVIVLGAAGTTPPSAAMLWVATAVGGLAAIPIIQIIKTLIDKILGKILGAGISSKLMTWVAWGICYGVAAAVYAVFGGLPDILANGFGIFVSGSTVGQISSSVYKLVADGLGWSRDEATA